MINKQCPAAKCALWPTRGRRFMLSLLVLTTLTASLLLGQPLIVWGQATAGQHVNQPRQLALTWGTYLGGRSDEFGRSVGVDAAGNIYVVGETYSSDFPGANGQVNGYSDLLIAKFDPTGTQLLYSHTIGGNDSEEARGLVVRPDGEVYVTGRTTSADFPTLNAILPAKPEQGDGVLVKIDANGGFVFATYLPIDFFSVGKNLALDDAGDLYITGKYPNVTDGDTWYNDQIALLKLSADGQEALWNFHYGGRGADGGTALAVDGDGYVYIAGNTESFTDAFPVAQNAAQSVCGEQQYGGEQDCYRDGVVVIFDPSGEPIYATYIGGNKTDVVQAIAVDANKQIYVAGRTSSDKFPFVNAQQSTCPLDNANGGCYSPQAFVTALAASHSEWRFSTLLGSSEASGWNEALGLAVDPQSGILYVAGMTNGIGFPLQAPIQSVLGNGICNLGGSERRCNDAFIAAFASNGTLLFSTYFGGGLDETAYGITVDSSGNPLFVGHSDSTDFPLSQGAYQPAKQGARDLLLVKLGAADSGSMPTATPAPLPTATPTVTPGPTSTPDPRLTERLYLPAVQR